MALPPKSVMKEDNRISLISSRSLDTFRQGFRGPDLSSGLRIAVNARLRDERQKREQDEAYEKQRQVLKDYASLPVRDSSGWIQYDREGGTLEERRTFDKLLQNSYATELEGMLNEEFNRIQDQFEVPANERMVKMTEFAQSALQGAPEEFQPSMQSYVQSQLGARRNAIFSEQRRRDRSMMVRGAMDSIGQLQDEAVSAIAAGQKGARDAAMLKIRDKLDLLRELGQIDEGSASAILTTIQGEVTMNAANKLIIEGMWNGRMDPAEVAQFGESLLNSAAGDATIEITETDAKSGDTVTMQWSTKALSETPMDKDQREELGRKLVRVGNAFQRQVEQYEKSQEYFKWLRDNRNTLKVLSSEYHDEMDDHMEILTADRDWWRNNEVAGTVLGITMKTRRISPVLEKQLNNITNVNDPESIADGLAFYAQLKGLRNENNEDVGNQLLGRLDKEVLARLDTALNAQQIGLSEERIQQFMQATADPNFDWNDHKKTAFGSWSTYAAEPGNSGRVDLKNEISARWMDSKGTMPPNELVSRVSDLYAMNSVLSSQSPDKNLEAAFQTVSKMYQQNEIFTQGFAMYPQELTDPRAGTPIDRAVKTREQVLTTEQDQVRQYEWLETFIQDTFTDNDTVLEINEPFRIQEQIKAAGGIRMGENAWLHPVDNHSGTFEIHMANPEDPEAGPMPVMARHEGPEGRISTQPMTVNVTNELNLMTSKADNMARLEQLKSAIGKKEGEIHHKAIHRWQDMFNRQGHGHKFLPGEEEMLKMDGFEDLARDREDARKGYESAVDRMNSRTGHFVSKTDAATKATWIEPKAHGQNVVTSVVKEVDRLFPDGTGGKFLFNTAATESDLGKAPGTFRTGQGDHGIWQINYAGAFPEVKRLARQRNHVLYQWNQIAKKELGVDVTQAGIRDLNKPLVSALFARFYYKARIGNYVPKSINDQARLWKKWYNTHLGAGTESDFIRRSRSRAL